MRKFFGLLVLASAGGLIVNAGPGKTSSRQNIRSEASETRFQNFSSSAMTLFLTNSGELQDPKESFGIEYPAGSGRHPLFDGGFGISGFIQDTLFTSWQLSSFRVSDWQPGPVAPELTNADDPRFKVYKYRTGDSPAINPDAETWPADLGAPFNDLNGNGIYEPDLGDLPEISGSQMMWLVANDLVPPANRRWGGAGSGIELQLSVFFSGGMSPAFDRTVLFQYKLINKSGNLIKNTVFSLVSDPDLGGSEDDLAGCDTTRRLVYCYNQNPNDRVYPDPIPAIGFALLSGPRVFTGNSLDTARFGIRMFPGYREGKSDTYFILSRSFPGLPDPVSRLQARNNMMGLKSDSSFVDPLLVGIGGLPTDEPVRVFPGIPELSFGWRDALGGDRRMMINTEPFDFAPGDTQFILSAVAIGQGETFLESITDLRKMTDTLRSHLPDLLKPLPNHRKTGVLNLKLIDHTGAEIHRASLAIVKKGEAFWEKRFYDFTRSHYSSILYSGDYTAQAIGYDDVWGAIPDTAIFDFTIPADGTLDTVIQVRRIPGYEDRFYGNFAPVWKTGFPGDSSSGSPAVSWQVTNGYFGWTSPVPKGKYTTEVSVDLTHYVYPVLSLDANYRLNGKGDTLFIYGSGDNGKSWTKLDSWQGEWLTNWVFKSYDLDLFLQITDTVRIRFCLVKNSGSVTQMKLDNFKITHYGYTPVASEKPLPQAVRLLPAYPNPFNPSTTLRWMQPVAAEAGIRIFNVLGQQVMTVQTGVLPAGESSLAVDFTGLPTGIYIINLEVGRKMKATGKVLLVK